MNNISKEEQFSLFDNYFKNNGLNDCIDVVQKSGVSDDLKQKCLDILNNLDVYKDKNEGDDLSKLLMNWSDELYKVLFVGQGDEYFGEREELMYNLKNIIYSKKFLQTE